MLRSLCLALFLLTGTAMAAPEASDPADLDRLTVLLTGAIDRREFGADGYPAYVGPGIALRIVARIEK